MASSSGPSEAPAKLPGANNHEKLLALAGLTYSQQAIWFLNAFWSEYGERAEDFWGWAETIGKFDLQNGGNGTGVDELNAHRFLEHHQETMTVLEMRSALRKTGAIEASERPKLVPLIHFILVKFGVDWVKLVNASQGDNQAEIREAQRRLDEVQKALDFARAREAEALAAEAPFKAAQEEVEAALAEVHREEASYHGKIADAERRSTEGGAVSMGRAKNELAQLKAEDPLPLRKAKITLEAAQKRAEKARAPFLVAREAAEAARAAVEDRFAEAEAYLKEVSAKAGESKGQMWWLERILQEKRKFMPTSRGGTAR